MIQCPKCSNESADNAHFCGFCGARFQGAAPSQTIFGMQSAIPVAAPVAAPAPVAATPSPALQQPFTAPAPVAAAPSPALQQPFTAPAPVAAPAQPPAMRDAPATEPLAAISPAPAAATPAAPAAAAPAAAPAAKPDKDDEKAFFGASLSQYDLQGLNAADLVMDDFEERRKSPIVPIMIGALIIGAIAGAIVYFFVLS
jgi:hypothetical protein